MNMLHISPRCAASSQRSKNYGSAKNVKTDGSSQTIRFDGEGFYTQWLNQRVAVKSVSMIAELERETLSHTGPELHGFGAQGIDYRNPASYHASMDRMQDETHTGNHQMLGTRLQRSGHHMRLLPSWKISWTYTQR